MLLLLRLLLEVRREHVRGRHAEVLELLMLLLLARELLHPRRRGLPVEPSSTPQTPTHTVPDAHAARTEIEELCLVVRAQINAIPRTHAPKLSNRQRGVVMGATNGGAAPRNRSIEPAEAAKVVERLLLL